MYWTRDSGLCKLLLSTLIQQHYLNGIVLTSDKTPVVKVLLVWTSASSLVYMILTSKNYHSVSYW